MTRLPFDEHLTSGNPKLEAQVARTHAGMAHFAGTGPRGKTCRECIHWAFDGYRQVDASLKLTVCNKYTALMNGREGGRIPYNTAACKYFEADPSPPPIRDPKV